MKNYGMTIGLWLALQSASGSTGGGSAPSGFTSLKKPDATQIFKPDGTPIYTPL